MITHDNHDSSFHSDCSRFKTESKYFLITEINLYNRNKFCLHAFLELLHQYLNIYKAKL